MWTAKKAWAGLVRQARRYPWSSAAVHCGGLDPADLVSPAAWRKRWRRGDWGAVLAEGQEKAELEAVLRHTHTGRPWGSEAFVARLADQTGRSCAPGRGPAAKTQGLRGCDQEGKTEIGYCP